MSGSDWSPDSSASDVDEAPSALTTQTVEHATQEQSSMPQANERRRGRSPVAARDDSNKNSRSSSSSSSSSVKEGAPPNKKPRMDLASMIGAALRRGDVSLLPTDVTVEARAAQIVDALRQSGGGGEVAKAVTHALGDPLNKELRHAVLTGTMSPAALVALDEVSLLNIEKRAAQEKARLERLDQHSVEYLERLSLTVTNIYTCPACGSHECYANFRSTDFVKWGGDDQTPTLLRCCKCGHSFRR